MTQLMKDLGCLFINLMFVKTKLTGVVSVYLPPWCPGEERTRREVKEMRKKC